MAILLLRDLSALCATDIYGIYFRLSAQCLFMLTSWMCLMRPNDGRSISWNSLIKQSCSWHDEVIVYNIYTYIYIYIYIYIIHKYIIYMYYIYINLLYIYMYIDIYIYIIYIYIYIYISNPSKVKHKVKLMVKFVKTSTPLLPHSFFPQYN